MASNRKPTMMEMKQAVVNILGELSQLKQHVVGIDTALSGYIEFNGDPVKFANWMKKKMEEVNESRSTESGDGSGTAGNRKARKETSAKQNQKTQSGNPQAKESTRTSDKSS